MFDPNNPFVILSLLVVGLAVMTVVVILLWLALQQRVQIAKEGGITNNGLLIVPLICMIVGMPVLLYLGADARVIVLAPMLLGGGLVAVACGALDLDAMVQDRRTRVMVGLLGRGGARVFYAAVGILLTAVAVWIILASLGARG